MVVGFGGIRRLGDLGDWEIGRLGDMVELNGLAYLDQHLSAVARVDAVVDV